MVAVNVTGHLIQTAQINASDMALDAAKWAEINGWFNPSHPVVYQENCIAYVRDVVMQSNVQKLIIVFLLFVVMYLCFGKFWRVFRVRKKPADLDAGSSEVVGDEFSDEKVS